MATVALVNPQIVTSRWKAPYETTDDISIRHSLAQLSSVLKSRGHRTTLIDLRLLRGWRDFERAVAEHQPDVLCLTVHTCEREVAVEAARRAKAVRAGIWCVAGGIDPTMFPDLYLNSGAVDLILQGEGEVTLPQVLDETRLRTGKVYGESPDLSRLPFEDRELWPDYRVRTQKLMLKFPARPPQVDLILQRGCPWQCKFCCGPGEQNLYTKPSVSKRVFDFRTRSIEHIFEELKELDALYGFQSIVFHDDQFVIRESWAHEICEALHRHGYARRGVQFWAAIRADVICRHGEPGGLMEQLQSAGLHMVSIGFESFSDRQLKWMAKGTTREQNFRAAEIARKLGIHIFANFILGMPGPDGVWREEDDLLTLQAIQKIRPAVASSSFFSPIPGSPFYDHFVKNGFLKTDDPGAVGQRFPHEGKLHGVDYHRLDFLMDRYLAPYRSSNPVKHRIKMFLKKVGWFQQVGRIWNMLKDPAGVFADGPQPVSGKKL